MGYSNPIIVFHGHGSEYPFGPLADEMRRRGHQVIELDMARSGWRREMETLKDEPRILVTSHHPLATSQTYLEYYGIDDDILSLPELLPLLLPTRSYFVPHDLVRPFHAFEMPVLRHITSALMPDSSHWFLRRFCEVETIGWIGALKGPEMTQSGEDTADQSRDLEVLFLPSDIANHIRCGIEGFIADYAAVFALNPQAKMPRGRGFEAIEGVLIEQGCHLLPSNTPLSSLMGPQKLVICSGASSVVMEAASLGAHVISVQDQVSNLDEMVGLFQAWPNVRIATPQSLAQAIQELKARGAATQGEDRARKLKPFDVDRFEELCR
jgi:hypothetical protein